MKLIKYLLILLTFTLQSFALEAYTYNFQPDTLSEVIVRGKKIGYSKLLKDCYSNYINNTPHDFKQDFSGQSVLTRNEKLQFELNGNLRVDFVNYLNFNYFLIANDCKYSNNIFRSKNEDLTLYPIKILEKLTLDELKTIIKSNKYKFNAIRENNEIVEFSFAPKMLNYQSQKEIKSVNNLEEFESSDSHRFLYKGTIIINKHDLAFESIYIQLLNSNKNTTVSIINNFKASDKYLIEDELFELQFKKRNNIYRIVSFDLSTNWKQINLGQSNDLGRFNLKEHFTYIENSDKVYNTTKYDLYTISRKK